MGIGPGAKGGKKGGAGGAGKKRQKERKVVGPAGMMIPVLPEIGSFSMKSIANPEALATQLVASNDGGEDKKGKQ